MKWTNHGQRVYTAVGRTEWSHLGRKQAHTVAFRIDGRGEGGYRVDVKTLSYMPWEAINGGDPLPTLTACKSLVTRWVAASAAQQTLTPRLSKNVTEVAL